MAVLQTTIDLSSDLTTVKAIGRLTPEDYRDWVLDYYSENVTTLMLWDLESAEDLSGISDVEILENIRFVTEAAAKRRPPGGKTAIVVGRNDHASNLSRTIETFSARENTIFEIRAFTDLGDARKWLGI